MRHQHISSTLFVVAGLALASCGSEPKGTSTVTVASKDISAAPAFKDPFDPTFTRALLDPASVASLIADDKAWGIRVYNARRDDTDMDGTVVAIGIDNARGKELMGSDKAANYRRYRSLSGDRVDVDALTHPEAQASVKWVADAKDPQYCAEFSRREVDAMLGTEGMKAIQFTPVIMPTPEGTLYSMRAEPVSITGGSVRGLGGSHVCGEPCPIYCGTMPDDYLWK